LIAAVILAGLILFLLDRKWTRTVLTVCLPVFIILFFVPTVREAVGYAFLSGMTILCLTPAMGYAAERMKQTDTAVSGEDDILDNKTKWRLIIAGYVIFILFAIFSVISIIRLNSKINTLYGFTQDLEQRIEEVNK